MVDGVSSISGIDDMAAMLDELESDLRLRVVYAGLRAAAKPFIQAAMIEAPVLSKATRRRVPGTLRNSIKAFASKKYKGQNGILSVYVTERASRADLKSSPVSSDPYYFRWVAGGHKIVARFKGKYTDYPLSGRRRLTGISARRLASTSSVPPDPYFERSFEEANGAAVDAFTERIVDRIDKANKRK